MRQQECSYTNNVQGDWRWNVGIIRGFMKVGILCRSSVGLLFEKCGCRNYIFKVWGIFNYHDVLISACSMISNFTDSEFRIENVDHSGGGRTQI